MTAYIGIDPGQSGGIAVIYPEGRVETIKGTATEHDLSEWLEEQLDEMLNHDWRTGGDVTAVIEKVGASRGRDGRKQGVASSFKFGLSYGFLRGLLVAHKVPFEAVAPGVWQRKLGCLSQGDKNVTKAAAQRLFPKLKVTHAIADALLLAEYCRRTQEGEQTP